MHEHQAIGFKDIFFSLSSWKIKIIKILDYILGGLCCLFISPRKPTQTPFKNTHRILIIRPGGIGDAVFLSPFLNILQQKYPQIQIDILCEKRNKAIFQLQSFRPEQIYCYDQIKSFLALFKNQYGIIFDTEQWHYSSALVAFFLKSPNTIGFASRTLRTKLLHTALPYHQDDYETKNFYRLFSVIDDEFPEVKNINNCLKIPEYDLLWGQKQLSKKYVALHIGASIDARRLNAQQLITIIKGFRDHSCAIVLLGGHKDKDLNNQIMSQIKSPQLYSFVGKTSLMQTSAIINQCAIFVGSDSGILHLACALGIPVIAIFGPGSQKKWGPKGEHHKIFSAQKSCSPCTFFGYTIPSCKNQYFCMRDIDLDKIIQGIQMSLIPK